jgi:hypothetical protein
MKTAVDWLEEQLFELRNPTLNQIEIIKQAKEMEKEQIIEAFDKGDVSIYGVEINGQQYYNETFNK